MEVLCVLKIVLMAEVLFKTAKGDRCEVDYPWKHIGPGICMFVTSLQKSWDGAITYCASIHPRSQLPVLKDVSSVEYLHYTMSSLGKGSQEIWLNAFYDSSKFVWNDGTEVPKNHSAWGIGEPSGNGPCVSLRPTMKTVKGVTLPTMDDTRCELRKLVVCACQKIPGDEPTAPNVDALFKDSPSLGPYKSEYTKRTAAGGNPVLELEKVGIKAAMDLLQSNSTDVTETAITDQLKMEISKFTIKDFKGQKFVSLKNESSLELPSSVIQAINASVDYAATIGIAYSKLGRSNDLSKKATLPNSLNVWAVDSDIVTFSVIHDQLNFTKPIILKFTSKHEQTKQEGRACAFWNTTLGTWSQDGCYKMITSSNTTVCHCYHLTTFASLMQVTPDQHLSKREAFAVNIITYVCFGLSYVGLCITILYIIISKSFMKPSNFIHFNLCVAVLVAQSTFLAGITPTKNRAVCKFVAALLHFLYLSVACWMFVEGLFILRMTRSVFYTNRNVLGCCLIGWGVPAFVVTILFSFLNKSYGYEAACWLDKETGVIWAFVGPMILILLFNFIVLVITVRAALNIKMNKSKSEKQKIAVGIKAIAVLLPLLGITWVFGVLAIGPAAKPMQIIFAVCNGLQGFFIFLFHCVRNPELRLRNSTRQTNSSGSPKNKVGPSNSSSGPTVTGKAPKQMTQ